MGATHYDVAVVGGGNAALCAALTARAAGARVVVIEAAPRHLRGGNSRHTRNLRVAHDAPTDVLTGQYSTEEFWSDLLRVSGATDDALARLVIAASATCPRWMRQHGARFQSALTGTLHLARTNAFFLGGGKALMNAYYAAATRAGVDVCYESSVEAIAVRDGRATAVEVGSPAGSRRLTASAFVLASGGFEANLAWLREAWGPAADAFVVRGTPFNTGTVLRLMMDAGAATIGDARACHAIAVDARAPKVDGGIVTRLDTIPFGIVVNGRGERFADEGADLWPKRYASWGRLVAEQAGQIAYAITDAKVGGLFMPPVFPPIVAPSLRQLAERLPVPADALEATVRTFNGAVRPGRFDPAHLDECGTEGLTPPKSHWAQTIDTPPFRAHPLRPGITFTYLGLRVDAQARVLLGSGAPSPNIYAAGEIMAGNILRGGYAAGIGMTIGTVFGRIAGEEAARTARHATA